MRMLKNWKILGIIGLIFVSSHGIFAQPDSPNVISNEGFKYLTIPERSENALGGSEFASQLTGLSITDREDAVVREILAGNMPSFSRKLKPIKIIETLNALSYEIVFYATCDYMAIGSDQDYLYIPMTTTTAQYLAETMNCTLPTKKLVDVIYTKAEIKLHPQPIPPSELMTTVPQFSQHTDSIILQMSQIGLDRSADNIIAGHKKDIIISNKIYSSDRTSDRVVIYGWHLGENDPIQPVYNGHVAWYADYSHGVRLVSKLAFINGDSIQVDEVLMNPKLSNLLSSEGLISRPYYPGK
jgi:hypothetical protein